MSTKSQLIEVLEEEISFLRARIEKLLGTPELDKLELTASFFGSRLDFNRLTHQEVIEVIQAIGGKWEKTPNEVGIDYEHTTPSGLSIRLWKGEPPPNCKVVEVEQLIPAQPKRVVTVKKIVCPKT